MSAHLKGPESLKGWVNHTDDDEGDDYISWVYYPHRTTVSGNYSIELAGTEHKLIAWLWHDDGDGEYYIVPGPPVEVPDFATLDEAKAWAVAVWRMT